MSGRSLAELALKVWGIILILGAVLTLPATLLMLWAVPAGDEYAAAMRGSQIAYFSNLIVQALGGVVIVVWADRIVSLFESGETPLQIDISGAELQVLAFAIVGIVTMIDGLQNAAGAGYTLVTDQADTSSYM